MTTLAGGCGIDYTFLFSINDGEFLAFDYTFLFSMMENSWRCRLFRDNIATREEVDKSIPQFSSVPM